MSFTVFCFGAATPNLEVQKIKSLGLVRSKFGHNYRRQGTYRRSSIPPPPAAVSRRAMPMAENLERPDLGFLFPWASISDERT